MHSSCSQAVLDWRPGQMIIWSYGLALALQTSVPCRSFREQRRGGLDVSMQWWQLGRLLLDHSSRNTSFNPTKLLPQGNFLLDTPYFCSKITIFCSHMHQNKTFVSLCYPIQIWKQAFPAWELSVIWNRQQLFYSFSLCLLLAFAVLFKKTITYHVFISIMF